MIFLVVLVVATAAAAAVAGLRRSGSPRAVARVGFGAALVVAGLTHLLNPVPFEQHLPSWVPLAGAVVAVSGIVEIGLGVALASGARRRLVGLATAAFLVLVFPANVYVAVAGVDVDGQPGGVYPWLRLPLQALFVAWVLWATAGPARSRAAEVVEPEASPPRHGGA